MQGAHHQEPQPEHHERYVVYVTAPRERAEALARLLVERRLVACVNVIGSVRSIYRWSERTCEDEESLLVMKTSGRQLEPLRAVVLAEHPYEVPEVIALPIVFGHPEYLAWIDASVG